MKLNNILSDFSKKSLFGNAVLISDGVNFGQIAQNKLYLKVPSDLLDRTFKFDGVQFNYEFESRSLNRNYYFFEQNLLDNNEFIAFLLDVIAVNKKLDLSTQKTFMNIRGLFNLNMGYEFMLKKVGVKTLYDLSKYKAVGCFILLLEAGLTQDFNMLVKLHGAIEGKHFYMYSKKDKKNILSSLNESLKRANMRDFKYSI